MAYRQTEHTRARAAERRDHILRATARIVAAEGWASVTLARVASEAGVSSGNVYTHFADKGELVGEAFRVLAAREQQVVLAAVDAVLETAGPDLVRRALDVHLRSFCGRALQVPRLAWAMLHEPSDPVVEAGRIEFRRGYRDMMRRIVDRGVEVGELPQQNSALVADLVSGGIGAALVRPLQNEPGSTDLELLITDLTTVCLRAVGADPAKEIS